MTGLIGVAAGLVIGAAVGAIYSYSTTGAVDWGAVGTAALIGAAAGGLIGVGAGAVAAHMITGNAWASTGTVLGTVLATNGEQIANAATQVGQVLQNTTTQTSNTISQLVNNAATLGRTNTVMGHLASRSYQESTLLIREIMQAAKPTIDLSLSNGLKWVVEGSFNNSYGIYELVINVAEHKIVHFLYRS